MVPAQITTMPPRFTTKTETGKVASPGCSNTISTLLLLPVISQIALPNLRVSLNHALYSGVFTVGIWPQQLKSLRLITPLAPIDMTNSRLSSSEITPIALAPAALTNWIA
ncbi:hypothetical protein GALL_510700 [mine drainage metagenome]|uniref:Uncharacterized protein n=1 Tax=mine drainage metagenome TaxID=410659 RepID=A0A1J5P7Y3_9ZZZZ